MQAAISFLCGIIVAMFVLIPLTWMNCNIDRFTDCNNIPPMFQRAYNSLPNMFKPAGTGIPVLPLGANSTMVFDRNTGSCSSNINGVNRVGPRNVSRNTQFCTDGSMNPFNI